MLGFAGVGFLGAVNAVSGMETWAKDFLLALPVATPHGLDDIVKTGFLFHVLHRFGWLISCQ